MGVRISYILNSGFLGLEIYIDPENPESLEMLEPHKHHFIPRFYQRGFVPGRGRKIWVYEKDGKPLRRSIRSVGMQVDLYAFERAGQVDFGSVEKELALVEDHSSKNSKD